MPISSIEWPIRRLLLENGIDLDEILRRIGDPTGDALNNLVDKLGNPATALATRIGNPDAHALASLVAKLGNPATDFNTRIGNPDAHTLTSLTDKWGNSPDTQALMHSVYLGGGAPVFGSTALTTWQTLLNKSGIGLLCSIFVGHDSVLGNISNTCQLRVTIDGVVVNTWDSVAEWLPYITSHAVNDALDTYPISAFFHFMFPYRTSLLVEYRIDPAGWGTMYIACHYTDPFGKVVGEKWFKGEKAKKLGLSDGKYRIRKSADGIGYENVTPIPKEIQLKQQRNRLMNGILALESRIDRLQALKSRFPHLEPKILEAEKRKETLEEEYKEKLLKPC